MERPSNYPVSESEPFSIAGFKSILSRAAREILPDEQDLTWIIRGGYFYELDRPLRKYNPQIQKKFWEEVFGPHGANLSHPNKLVDIFFSIINTEYLQPRKVPNTKNLQNAVDLFLNMLHLPSAPIQITELPSELNKLNWSRTERFQEIWRNKWGEIYEEADRQGIKEALNTACYLTKEVTRAAVNRWGENVSQRTNSYKLSACNNASGDAHLGTALVISGKLEDYSSWKVYMRETWWSGFRPVGLTAEGRFMIFNPQT